MNRGQVGLVVGGLIAAWLFLPQLRRGDGQPAAPTPAPSAPAQSGSRAETSSPVPPLATTGPSPVEILSDWHLENTSIDGAFWVIGQVRNNGSTSRQGTTARITFYDAAGKVLGTDNFHLTDTVLQPGETRAFKGITSTIQGKVDRATLVVEAPGR